MIGQLGKRLSKLEVTPLDLPPEIRQWLGHPINDAERATIKPVCVVTKAEETAELAALPRDVREWFGGRLRPTLQQEGQ